MYRSAGIAAVLSVLFMAGCSKETPPAAPAPASSAVYSGTLFDSVLATQMTNAGLVYNGSVYRYTLKPDSTFTVEQNVGMGFSSPASEEGSYGYALSTGYRFTPSINRRNDRVSHQMVQTDSLRPPYSAALAGDTLAIADFLNIDNKASQRNLGTLKLARQQ